MSIPDRIVIADRIVERLRSEQERIAADYAAAAPPYFIVDDLLPQDLATAIYQAFPAPAAMMLRNTFRERKYVSSQMNRCDALVEEAVFAWQDPRLLGLISELTGIAGLEGDRRLYAAGISLMGRGHFLSPHLDNSHDMEGRRYRALNTLYYVSPGWKEECGGSLELWPEGPKGKPVTLPSLFNRLIVIATNRSSWHSVCPIRVDAPRTCVSNYYFSRISPEGADYAHSTSFRGRPDQPLRDWLLRGDTAFRSAARRLIGRSVTRHYYKKGE
jgi:Rps23 Pro-64 3,4-dihydroxylase Tpa1-like proline 4-hydroxylase